MDEEEKEAAIRYGTYAYANKEAEFINADLFEQLQAGQVTVFPLETVNYLHNLLVQLRVNELCLLIGRGISPIAVGCLFLLLVHYSWKGDQDAVLRCMAY